MTDTQPPAARGREADGPMAQRAATARAARQEARRRAAREQQLRRLAFGGIVAVVLAVGGYLAFGDFLHRPADAANSGIIDVQSSMAGFTPSEIHVTAGKTITFRWWTQDAAMHLSGGVHTMIAPALGLDETLPAEGSRIVSWAVPDKPGTYDVYCDSCCGGKDNPVMHGKIVVES